MVVKNDDNISKQKQIERKLRESKDRFRSIAENMADWIWEVDVSGHYTYCSNRVEAILGYSPDEIIGKTPFDFMCPEDKERISIEFRKFAQTIKPFSNLENWNITKDGKRICLLTSGTPILDKDGNYCGYRGVDSDITERKKALEELITAKEFAENLLETANVIVATIKSNADIASFNRYAEEITGYKKENVIGRNWFDLFIPKRDKESIPKVFNELLNNMPKVFNQENSIVTKNGEELIISWNNSVLRNSSGDINGILSIGMDITKRKKTEVELIKAQAESEIANKTKSMFLANMSHELRTPLNAIMGFGQLLEIEQNNLDDRQIEFLEHIKHASKHLLEMVNDILDLSKIESGSFDIDIKQFNLKQMLLRLLKSIKSLAFNKNIELIIDIDLTNELICADEIRLKQVLYNLLSNAIKFTSSGKKIGIRAETKVNNAVIEVWDKGIGISNKDLEKIFDPFIQVAKVKQQGTGLGLSISRKLIELHGGTLIVESRIKEGSRFIINLPGVILTRDCKTGISAVKDTTVKRKTHKKTIFL